ncbi:MAG: OmpA family protein [Chitinophagales bacterium]
MRVLLCATLLLTCFTATPQQINKTIYFEHDEYSLDENDQRIISELAGFLADEKKPISSVEIYGFADTIASVNYNKTLSKKRSEAVYISLVASLPSEIADRIKTYWYGESIPVTIKKDLNYSQRCVDIVIYYEDKKEVNISELFEQLRMPVQRFSIDPTKDTILKGNAGTIISISANSFYIPKSCIGSTVDIVLQESYNLHSMLLNNLTTKSGETQLQTDGMIFLNAQACNRILTLKEDSPVSIMFPVDQPNESMQFFTGNKDQSGAVDWKVSSNALSIINGGASNYLSKWNFSKKHYRKKCPFLFCGVRERLNIDNTAYYEKKAYYAIDYKAWRKYMDSVCAAYGVKSYHMFYRMMEEKQKRDAAASYYLTSTTNLGWMNCDRFMSLPEEKKVTVMVDQKASENIASYLVFSSYKSILPGNYANETGIGFTNIGRDEKCFVVLIKYENRKPFMSITEIVAETGLIVKPQFREYTVEELKAALAIVNS